MSGGIQPRQEDEDKDNECDTQRKKSTGRMGDSNQMNEIMKCKGSGRGGLSAPRPQLWEMLWL